MALKKRSCDLRGCTRLATPAATMSDAFDSFPMESGENEKAVLGIFLHQADHYTAILQDRADPNVAWHVDSARWWTARRLEPTDFVDLVFALGVAALRVGSDPARWLGVRER